MQTHEQLAYIHLHIKDGYPGHTEDKIILDRQYVEHYSGPKEAEYNPYNIHNCKCYRSVKTVGNDTHVYRSNNHEFPTNSNYQVNMLCLRNFLYQV